MDQNTSKIFIKHQKNISFFHTENPDLKCLNHLWKMFGQPHILRLLFKADVENQNMV